MISSWSDFIAEPLRFPNKSDGKAKGDYIRFTCRTAATAAMLKQAMEDRAAMNGIPVYNAFEDALLDAVLPNDPTARAFTQLVLGEQKGIWKPRQEGMRPVQHALHTAFKALADVKNGLWELPENPDLARFAMEYAEESDLVALSEKDPDERIPRALDAAREAVASKIREAPAPAGVLLDLRCVLDFDAVYWGLGKCLMPDTLFFALSLAWQEAWALPELRDLVLTVLETPTDGEDSARDRSGFTAMCNAVMPAWTAENARREVEREKQRLQSMIQERNVKGGTIRYPITWRLANPDAPAEWRHAAAVSVVSAIVAGRRGELKGADAASRIVLLPCPFEDVGETEEERSQRVIEMACASWPDLPRILDARVELKYARSGKPINWDEWKTSLRVSVSKVPEMSAAAAATGGYAAWIEKDGCY